MTETFSITVNPQDDAPQITSSPVTSVLIGDSYAYDVEAYDEDAQDTLIYSVSAQTAAGLIIDSGNRPMSALTSWT